jgi:pyruvate/2-oxoglutarate/acetoin dehydrogenase E1 component
MPDTTMTTDTKTISLAAALRDAMDLCMERDPNVFVIGQGATAPGRLFGSTTDLLEKYGPDRVQEMPLAENGVMGALVGAAMAGMRPVMVCMRTDFLLLTLDQIVNHAAKSCYLTGGERPVPLVIRACIGRGWGQGPTHVQSLEAMFAMVPGLKVVMPSSPAEGKGQLIAAIEDPNPVVFLEHRWLHDETGAVPTGYYRTPLDGPRLVRPGRDVTVVATSLMVLEARRAADALASVGVECEVIDLAVLRPLRIEPVIASVEKTGRLITVDTGWRTLGLGAEVVARVTERAFGALKTAPVRLGVPDHPSPSSMALLEGYDPTAAAILRAAGEQAGLTPAELDRAQAALTAAIGEWPVDVPVGGFRGAF